ncbi:hypothetical protein EVAR_51265_1 [Eumeta japonica]|uniref:Uncharacterized protein n=1 Tax=Eumeta variegata TaxID=151549 RepID=A0A4C1Y7V5_EUMVA|nr:hypothetical protein EVAR_51265_1 [Eumeta japonica]
MVNTIRKSTLKGYFGSVNFELSPALWLAIKISAGTFAGGTQTKSSQSCHAPITSTQGVPTYLHGPRTVRPL